MDKYNVVIDTNVIVSVLISQKKESPTYKVLELVFNGEIQAFYSKKILDEYIDVLSRKAFGFNEVLIDNLIGEFMKVATFVEPKNLETVLIDMKDKPFYELVLDPNIEKGKLITGNIKHFPKASFIMTPRDFINNIYRKDISKRNNL